MRLNDVVSEAVGAVSRFLAEKYEPRLTVSLGIWSILWLWRYQKSDPTALQDLCICIVGELRAVYAYGRSGLSADGRQPASLAFHALLSACVLLAFFLWNRSLKSKIDHGAEASHITSKPWAKALIFPSRTTHSRFSPRKHSFSYSYLLVGVPIDSTGTSNRTISVGTSAKYSVLSIDAGDYLDRDSSSLGFRHKLDQFLLQQDVDPAMYPNVYLVTAPRVLGYSFNPASFWYLYLGNNELGAMIVEVNNTFDEKRVYFLQSNDNTSSCKERASFTSKWEKDFHVSPFNSRDGIYSLRAQDPLPAQQMGGQAISNTITLASLEGKPMIVARIFSVDAPMDADTLRSLDVVRLLWRHGWTGYLTFPRILAEASKLYFAKQMPVWYRPEVTQSSIGRRSTWAERELECFFSLYLQHTVQRCPGSFCLIYTPAPDIISKSGRAAQLKFTSKAWDSDNTAAVVQVKVLSPAFYSRFVHYAHDSEAFDNECFLTGEKNRTILISQPELFTRLIDGRKGSTRSQSEGANSIKCLRQWTDRIRWRVLRSLRCPPAQQCYPSPSSSSLMAATGSNRATSQEDIRYFSYSPLDAFVQRHCKADAWRYRRLVSARFIAERAFLGLDPLLALVDLLLRFTAMTAGLHFVCCPTQQSQPMSHGPVASIFSLSFPVQVAGLISVHLWSLIKGLP